MPVIGSLSCDINLFCVIVVQVNCWTRSALSSLRAGLRGFPGG